MVWSPNALLWTGWSKTQCPVRGFGVPTVSPCTILDILEIWGDFFCTAKGTIKSAAPAPPDFTPKSLKSYFLIFLDLQSLLTICNPLGPSGNKCRMQHILLIERFAIKEDSPLHTTKASPGGSSRSSWKNASGSAWQLRFSWFLCRPNTALAPSCSTEVSLYTLAMAPLLACSASAHISVPGVTIFNTDAVSANPDGCATVTLERTIKIHLNNNHGLIILRHN
jgi:hypothetical protein